MLKKYIQIAMMRARYKILDDGTFFGNIKGFQGVWANADTLEACRNELEEVLEGWIILSLEKNLPIPIVDDIDLIGKRYKEAS